jgi:hypothetical protein
MMKLKGQRVQTDTPHHNLAPIRVANSSSSFRPAEEQFIEQTPWANPQHPSHAHLLQRQTSAHQAARTASPFSIVSGAPPRRHSHHHATGAPVSGTFSSTSPALQSNSNGSHLSGGGRISPLNPFTNTAHSQKVAPSPLGSRQPSLSPQHSRPQGPAVDRSLNIGSPVQITVGPSNTAFLGARPDNISEFTQEAGVPFKREQITATNGRY